MCPILQRAQLNGSSLLPFWENKSVAAVHQHVVVCVCMKQEICSRRSVSLHSHPGREDGAHHWGQHRDREGDCHGPGRER